MHWFGLAAVEGSPATWGARAIDDGQTFGLVPGRQSVDGEEAHTSALFHILNKMGVLKLAQEAFGRLKRTHEIRGGVAALVTLYEDWLVRVEANTNGSHGYVYVRAYIKPEGYTPKLVRSYPNGDPDAIEPGTAVWSNEELPEVGETVIVTRGSEWASKDREMVVLGYVVEYGHLHVAGYLPNPTPEWEAQTARDLKRSGCVTYYNVMGREWARPMVVANGYKEVADAAAYEKMATIKDRDTRRGALRQYRQDRDTRYPHITEVYTVIFRKGKDALLVGRQYNPVGTMSAEEAKDLVARSVVGNVWEGYSLTHVPNSSGTAVWLAYPGSTNTNVWEAKDSTAVVAAL